MNINEITTDLRKSFNAGITRAYSYRKQQLLGLQRFLNECESEIQTALHHDLGKPLSETLSSEIGMVSAELKFTLQNLSKWMKKKRVSTPLIAQPGISHIYPEPLGVVLIISPWNYPLQLALTPLIGALAAGNCVVLKPSEIASATSHLLARKLPDYISSECLSIVEGGVSETTALLAEYFDYIFYTGNSTVGRIIMMAAAKNLTPVTLELGGKSPCIVDADANLSVAARRIIWAKFSNAGQTCVAPDYILAHESAEEKLLIEMRTALEQFYGSNPKESSDYGRIINSHHYQRLMKLISGSGETYVGGTGDESIRYIEPTILRHVSADAPIMADEIFGPLLPVITIKNMDEAIRFINSRPKPLALYLFSNNKIICERVLAETSSGSVSINYPMLQLAVPSLPFGGVGASGMGAYHGKASFDTFSHDKSVLYKPSWFDLSILYPPHTSKFIRLIRWLLY